MNAPLATLSLLAACLAVPALASDGRDLHSVNGEVSAAPGQAYGTLSTVNGEVTVGRGATADEAKTVNGEITVEDDARLGTVSTVNGGIEVRAGASIERSASAVNGEIDLKRAHVGGDVTTVSGGIEVEGGEIGGKIETRNGDIDLKDGARVRGGLYVRKNNGNSWRDNPIKVHVCATCVVEGDLTFEQPVELRVDTGGKIGKVVGDKVTRR